MVHRFLIIGRSVVFAVGELVAWARGNRRRIRVSGSSMEPTLDDADQILMKPLTLADTPAADVAVEHATGDARGGEDATPSRSIGVGSVVVFEHPDPSRELVLVKRVESILDSGALVVVSDNRSHGTDSRTFGPIHPGSVLGVATLNLQSLRAVPPTARAQPSRTQPR